MKGSAYLGVWQYTIHEMEDAVGDCKKGNIADNDGGAHAWDEAVAFYAGSLEGAAPLVATSGEMLFRLAQKRCKNFNTCGKLTGTAGSRVGSTSGIAIANQNILASFKIGAEALATYRETTAGCDSGAREMNYIKAQMSVPMVQGMLRYAYKGEISQSPKERMEGHVFMMAILPQINTCSSAAADLIKKNMDFASTKYVADGYKAVYNAMYGVLPCMGLTCEDIGGLVNSGSGAGATYYEGTDISSCTSIVAQVKADEFVDSGLSKSSIGAIWRLRFWLFTYSWIPSWCLSDEEEI